MEYDEKIVERFVPHLTNVCASFYSEYMSRQQKTFSLYLTT